MVRSYLFDNFVLIKYYRLNIYYSVYILEYTSTDWWKNLEDNTIRPSTASNILNQTSRQLDSNSQIKTSQVTDGWWKALEVTNISNSSKVNENIITKGMYT